MKLYPEDMWTNVGTYSHYKIFWIRSDSGIGVVCIPLAEEWIEKVYDFNRISDCFMMIKFVIDNNIIILLSCYTSEVGLYNTIKDTFYELLHNTVSKVSAAETLVRCGNFDGYGEKN